MGDALAVPLGWAGADALGGTALGEAGLALATNPVGWAILGTAALYIGYKVYQNAHQEAEAKTTDQAQDQVCSTCEPPPPDKGDDEKKRRDKQLRDAADKPDRGGLTKAGRALAKHGGRPGSSFPQASGSPEQINQQGEAVVDDILSNPRSTTSTPTTGRFGQTIEVRAPDGRGLRYSGDGTEFIGFLEP